MIITYRAYTRGCPVKCRAMRKHMKAQTKMADEAEGKDLVRTSRLTAHRLLQ